MAIRGIDLILLCLTVSSLINKQTEVSCTMIVNAPEILPDSLSHVTVVPMRGVD